MPQYMGLRDVDTAEIVFPLTLNELPFDLSGVTNVAMAYAGLDGKLQEVLVNDSTVSVRDESAGYVQFARAAGDWPAAYGPYRVYFLCTVSGGVITVPRDDYFLVDVRATTFE